MDLPLLCAFQFLIVDSQVISLLKSSRSTRYRSSFPTLARSDPIFYANCFDETGIYTIKLLMGSSVSRIITGRQEMSFLISNIPRIKN